jgi:hypothetical protein
MEANFPKIALHLAVKSTLKLLSFRFLTMV